MNLNRRDFLKISSASALSFAGAIPTDAHASMPREDATYVPRADFASAKKVFVNCRMCAQFCPMVAYVYEGKVIKFEANPNTPYPAVCGRGRSSMTALYNNERIKTPLIRVGERGSGEFRQATWEEALDKVADKMRELRQNGEARSLAYMPRFNAAPGLDNYFISVFGSPNTFSYADSCFASSVELGLGAVYGGRPGSAAVMGDYENSKLGVLIGRNPAGGLVAFPWAAMFGRGRKNGMKTVIIDPRKPAGVGEVYSDWLPVIPGTDLALVNALMYEIIANKYYDEEFLLQHTNSDILINPETLQPHKIVGSENADYLVYDEASKSAVMKSSAKTPALLGTYTVDGVTLKTGLQMLLDSSSSSKPEDVESVCGVSADQIKKLASDLNDAKPACFLERGYRTSRYFNSTREKQVISMINALLGVYGAKGGLIYGRNISTKSPLSAPKIDVMPIDRHYKENVQGFELIKEKQMRRMFPVAVKENRLYKLRMVFLNGMNAIGGGIGVEMVEAFNEMESIVALSPYWNESVMYADVILPTATFMERDEPAYSGYKATFPVLTLHQKAVDPLFDSRDGYWVIDQLAKRIFNADEYEQYFAEVSRNGGAIYLRDSALKNITGMNDAEKASFSMDTFLMNGVWTGVPTPVKFKVGKTRTGKMEPYSLFMAEWNAKLKAQGRDNDAEYFTPLGTWADPYWKTKQDTLGSDEFVTITGFHPLSSFTGAQTRNNIMLKNIGMLTDYDAVFINKTKGEKLGLSNNDIIEIFNIEKPDHVTQARVMLTETVNPETLFTFYGVGAGHYNKSSEKLSVASKIGFNPNHIANLTFAPLDGTAPAQDFIVKIRRAK